MLHARGGNASKAFDLLNCWWCFAELLQKVRFIEQRIANVMPSNNLQFESSCWTEDG